MQMTKEQYSLYQKLCREDWYERLNNYQKIEFDDKFWLTSNDSTLGLEELEIEIRKWLKERDYYA
ncbi:hypothetical protein FNU3_114 [Fusobacterium phage vB_FnuS_FNU3]|uniref:Uncharacterized protein n=1 Tax=Fusobacterium phage Fnu1 TaxID=2530024 RepID=A0A481W7J2_9CAUD|nr:hypothetical protein KMD24_gp093 [Fusobacterium phage Fnu1]QBJ04222.1 hypothetical protein [Fusobacterium phage Fnu1]WGH50449.1 hypothetical protein FNU3_114 [Fusobacterium phage vB_FnuS_FNU3]